MQHVVWSHLDLPVPIKPLQKPIFALHVLYRSLADVALLLSGGCVWGGCSCRDLKTSNVLLMNIQQQQQQQQTNAPQSAAAMPLLKLGDFGVSKVTGNEASMANSVVGTPHCKLLQQLTIWGSVECQYSVSQVSGPRHKVA
jgi:hypothetical protein